MNRFLLDILRCPFCSGKFSVISGDEQSQGWEYAVLACYCECYPVVAGIPIIRKGILGAKGEKPQTISRFIESGRSQDALLAMAMPPEPAGADLAPKWLQQLPQIKGMGRLKDIIGKFSIPGWARLAQKFIIEGSEHKTAKDYFRFHFLYSNRKEEYNYFLNRFAQPRQLVALSLMTLIESPCKPVLDFGCGFGHLTRHLPCRINHQPLIGADLDFMRLYVAKNILAPDASYVCCNGDVPLPFPDKLFSVSYVSDTLFMVTNKVVCSKEIQRVSDSDGLIIVSGIRNRLGKPHYSATMPYYTYGELFDSLPHRLLANCDVLDRYVSKLGPALSRSSVRQTLEEEPWFSIIATKREELLVDRGTFVDWPHAEGQLELNPLYKPVGKEGNGFDKTLYRHVFPSDWYQQEDGDCRKYEPESVSISSQVLKDLSSRRRTAEMEDLIARCVIVGVPDRFH